MFDETGLRAAPARHQGLAPPPPFSAAKRDTRVSPVSHTHVRLTSFPEQTMELHTHIIVIFISAEANNLIDDVLCAYKNFNVRKNIS